MDSIRKWRKSNPPAPGSVPYGKYSFEDQAGNVYSIDKFRPRFPLRWQTLQQTLPKQSNGKFQLLTDQLVIEGTKNILLGMPGWSFSPLDCGCGKMGGNLFWWRFAGGIVTLHKFKPFGSDFDNYSLLMEFNPNKHDLDKWRDLISVLRNGLGDSFCWMNTRIDYALDIPFPISDVRLLTRKIGSSYQGTYYFGTRGSSGYTRVYDKRKELIDKQKKDIGREVTRIEWEIRSGDPPHMDFPFVIQDLGRYEVLRYVPLCDWPAALRTYDPRTASKIKNDCLRSIDVDSAIYDRLSAGLFEYLGLSDDDNLDRIYESRIDAAELEDLERIQSQLRKWSGVEH